jgi:hypothetical protein
VAALSGEEREKASFTADLFDPLVGVRHAHIETPLLSLKIAGCAFACCP